MTTQTRDPVSFDASSGTWDATTFGTINDYPDTSTYLTHGTTAGNATWNINAPTVPAGAVNISVSVLYYRQKTASQTCAMAGRIKIGSTYYNGSTSNPTTSMALDTETWANNPATGSAWTPATVNNIAAIGVYSSDANPSIRVASIRLQITYNLVLTASQGSLALNGQAASLRAARVLTAGQGGFTLTGQDSSLLVSRKLAADYGGFTLTGQDATLTYATLGAYTLTAAAGSFTLTGQDAGLVAARKITAGQGAFTLTGEAAGLIASLKLTAGQGSYTLTGEAAGLIISRLILAAAGLFTLTGEAAGFTATRRLTADTGLFTLTGQDAELIFIIPFTGPGNRRVYLADTRRMTYAPGPDNANVADNRRDYSSEER